MATAKQVITKKYALYNGDCLKVLPELPDESVGFSVYSPPFASLYSYSDAEADMGNCKTYDEFLEHYSFLVKELYRLLLPGRIVAVHCMDMPTHKSSGEEIGISDFPGDLVRCHTKHGFIYHSRFAIWKDPLIAAVRTHAIGLAHKQIVKDSTMCRTGILDYILAFRKPGENPIPVEHKTGLTEYHGAEKVPNGLDRFLGHEDQATNKRSHWIWQRYASPVWMDIRQTKVLPYRQGRENDDERHICLARESLVLTKEHGYIPIQDVQVDDSVLTHLGRWRPVVAVRNNGVRKVSQLSAHGVPELKLTPDHKVWVRKSGWVRERDGAEKAIPKWIAADQCVDGFVNLKLPEVDSSVSKSNQLVWWIVGRWLADGHWGESRNSISITCGEHKMKFLTEKIGSYAGTTHYTGTAYQIRIKDRDRELREIISRCGKGASGKHLPPEAYSLPVEHASALLEGYLSGDGHFLPDRKRWMASSVSKPLLLGIAMIVQRVHGAIASVYAGRPARDSEIQGRDIKCKQDWALSFDLPGEGRRSPFIIDDGAWKRVRSVVPVGESEVWDIQVADDASFTAEGCIVHNCPLQTDVIERCLELWSTKGDTVLTPFMGVGSEVYCAVRGGRKGIGVELKASYFRQAVQNVESLKNKSKMV